MHPIERLRWIARAHDEAPATLAAEAAWTISELAADDPAAVVTACRRLVESHVTVGPLWWVAATLLAASDPDKAARRAVDDLLSDPTADLLAEVLNDRLPDASTVVVALPAETVQEGVSQLLTAIVRFVGSSPLQRSEVRRLERVVRDASGWGFDEGREALQGAVLIIVEALAAGPAGVLVARETGMLAALGSEASVPIWAVVGVGRVLHPQLLDEMSRRGGELVALIAPGSIEAVIGPSGIGTPAEGLGRQACPPAPELLVRAG